MKKLLPLAIALVAVWLWQRHGQESGAGGNGAGEVTADALTATGAGSWRSGDQVRAAGTVIRILDDDDDGDRHQRFILELASGRTLLVAHNIDVAPRVDSLREGDVVEFNGEYEPNDRGGVIHWTHADPRGLHVAGWLRHGGRIYQ